MSQKDTGGREVLQPIRDASPEVQRIIRRVLELEHGKLYLEKPHVIDDLLRIIKEEVK